MKRQATISRKTKETEITATVDLDGSGVFDVSTGIGFLDHMLEQLARHSMIDITLKAKGDLHIDFHHTTEDTGIVLGQAVAKALGDKKGITRYADVHLPMDETLTRVCIDVSGRPYLIWKVEFSKPSDAELELAGGIPEGRAVHTDLDESDAQVLDSEEDVEDVDNEEGFDK